MELTDYQGIQVFEELAREYDAWFDEHLPAYESELQALKRVMPPGGKGLEIGVGSGRFAALLGIKVGVEPAGAMARLARKRGIEVFRAVAANLPFKDESFDFVLLVTVLCFLPDPLVALREAGRVLKPRGRIIIGMLDRDSPLGREYEAKRQESRFTRHARFYPAIQVLKWLGSLGYEDFVTCQTFFHSFEEVTALEPIKAGHGEGGFVVISAQKSDCYEIA